MHDVDDGLTVARAYHAAWTTRQFDDAAQRLADGLTVEVPINDYPPKADSIRAVELTRHMSSAVHLLAEFGKPGEALLVYDLELPMTALRVAEHFIVRDGHIARIRQIHDTAALRAAGIGQAARG